MLDQVRARQQPYLRGSFRFGDRIHMYTVHRGVDECIFAMQCCLRLKLNHPSLIVPKGSVHVTCHLAQLAAAMT